MKQSILISFYTLLATAATSLALSDEDHSVRRNTIRNSEAARRQTVSPHDVNALIINSDTNVDQHHRDERGQLQKNNNLLRDPRIIGGFDTDDSRYTHTVSLQDRSGNHFCGGSLIAKDVVLTAAHCSEKVMGTNQATIVVIGRHDLTDERSGEELIVREEKIHPKHLNSVEFDYDVALLFLERPTMTRGDVLTLNSDSNTPSGWDQVTVLGWGDTNVDGFGDDLSDVLQEAALRVVPSNKCEKSEGEWEGWRVSYKGFIADSMICAKNKNRDSCQGDSGGPLILKGKNGKTDVQVGLVSWGVGCADAQFPGVYARVSSAYSWIRRQVCLRSIYPPDTFNCEPF